MEVGLNRVVGRVFGVGVHNVNISLNRRYMQSIADVSKLSVIALTIM